MAISLIMAAAASPCPVWAAPPAALGLVTPLGAMGFFGGVSEGVRLPKTTELLLSQANNNKAASNAKSAAMAYKELLFLDGGEPAQASGSISVNQSALPDPAKNPGSYTVKYAVAPTSATDPAASVKRNITFGVNYRYNGNQVILDYQPTAWTEAITTAGGAYALDPAHSHMGVSIIEDNTAGVTYYRGDISTVAVYTALSGPSNNAAAGQPNASGPSARKTVTSAISGSFFGYICAWSSAEVQVLDCSVSSSEGWQMQYQLRPSANSVKTMQYAANEPTAISFPGNYKEITQNKSGLLYNANTMPLRFYDAPKSGGVTIPSANVFEQLPAPDLSYLKGHFAQADIEKLFAMQVLDGEPGFYAPDQAMTRGQFVRALVKAVKLPITPPPAQPKNAKQPVITLAFPDITPDRPDYPYIMAAYHNGIAVGNGDGVFRADSPVSRQEAMTMIVRAIGLLALAPNPTPQTYFVDDGQISPSLKRGLYAAAGLGLVRGDSDGNINPGKSVTKGESAALLNRMIDYMRGGLAADYSQNVANFAG